MAMIYIGFDNNSIIFIIYKVISESIINYEINEFILQRKLVLISNMFYKFYLILDLNI